MVCGYRGEDMLEALCGACGRLDMAYEFANGSIVERSDVSLGEVTAYIGEVGWKPKTSLSGCSILCISVNTGDDSQVRLFSSRPEGESLYSTRDVLSRAVAVRVNTLRNIIPPLPDIRGYSGGSDLTAGFLSAAS